MVKDCESLVVLVATESPKGVPHTHGYWMLVINASRTSAFTTVMTAAGITPSLVAVNHHRVCSPMKDYCTTSNHALLVAPNGQRSMFSGWPAPNTSEVFGQ